MSAAASIEHATVPSEQVGVEGGGHAAGRGAPRRDGAVSGGHEEAPGGHEDAAVILPFLGIMLAIAVPFGLAVVAGVGGGLAVTGAAILTIAVVLVVMTRALSRVMGD